jgi:hypothetical protein
VVNLPTSSWLICRKSCGWLAETGVADLPMPRRIVALHGLVLVRTLVPLSQLLGQPGPATRHRQPLAQDVM